MRSPKASFTWLEKMDEALGVGDGCHLRPPDMALAIRDRVRTVRLPLHSIRWIDAAGDYICIHTDEKTHVLRATLRQLEKRLDRANDRPADTGTGMADGGVDAHPGGAAVRGSGIPGQHARTRW